MTLGLFWLFAPRFDWCLGVAISFFSDVDPHEKWPSEKNSELIERLKRVVERLDPRDSFRQPGLALLAEAKTLNDARNDFAHSNILAHGPGGELFVQKVRVKNKNTQLELQEGVGWSTSHVHEVTNALASWCERFEQLLADAARRKWPNDLSEP